MIFFTNLGLQQTNLQSVKTIIFRIKILGWSFFFKAIPKCYILTFEWVDILIFLCPYLLPIQFDKFFETGQFKEKTNSVHWSSSTPRDILEPLLLRGKVLYFLSFAESCKMFSKYEEIWNSAKIEQKFHLRIEPRLTWW